MTSHVRRWTDLAILTVCILLLWQGLHLIAGEGTLASPFQTFSTLAQLLFRPDFWTHVGATLDALAIAVAISMAIGIALGLALGFNRFSGLVLEPVLVSFFSLPKVTLYPLVLLIFGLGLSAKVAFGAMHALVPVTLIVMNAVRQIRPSLLRTARVLRMAPLATTAHVIVPAVTPALLSALQLGFSLSLLGVLIGEMFAAKAGLGFLLMNAIGLNDVRTLLAVTTLLFAFAILVNTTLRRLGARWQGAR